MTPGNYNIPSVVQGDTWLGMLLAVTVDTDPPSNALTAVQMRIKPSDDSCAKVELTSPENITITNAATWQVTIPAQVIPLRAAVWRYEIEFTDSLGNKFTYLKGNFTILA